VSLATKIKTKDAPKSVKSTKREPSMWECVNKMNTMVGSLGILTMARKGGQVNKKKKKGSSYG